jgi:hypothetical protein
MQGVDHTSEWYIVNMMFANSINSRLNTFCVSRIASLLVIVPPESAQGSAFVTTKPESIGMKKKKKGKGLGVNP